jgi:putative ABC transport system ATP-binding protein
MQQEQVILETKDLTFLDILSFPDLKINQGDFVFIEGESGAGKSTLLKLFNNTMSPTTGEIYFQGESIEDMDTIKLRREVLLISQSVFLFEGTIADNFDKFYDYREEPHLTSEEKEKFLNLARVPFNLSDSADNMSGGEQQRVYIAILLSFGPKVLMLDEPTSALDQRTAYELYSNLKDYSKKQGMTIITVSHDEGLLEEFSDHTISIVKGINYARHC